MQQWQSSTVPAYGSSHDPIKADPGLQSALEEQATARQEVEKRHRLLEEARQIQLIQLATEARPWILQEAAERVSHRAKQADAADTKLREVNEIVQRCGKPAAQLPLRSVRYSHTRLHPKSDKFNLPVPTSTKRHAADVEIYNDSNKENYDVMQSEQTSKRPRVSYDTHLPPEQQASTGFARTAERSTNNIYELRQRLAQRDLERQICRKGVKVDTKREIERIKRAETKRLSAIDEEEKRDHEELTALMGRT